jgi:superfamily II DNA or RNA helicase
MIKEKQKNNQPPCLRQHQMEALTEIRKVILQKKGKGRIVLPTGTGKTRIEMETVDLIIKQSKNKWPGVHVILSPRILLAYQQLDEFLKFFGSRGIECDYRIVNSGGLNSKPYEEELLRFGFEHPEEISSGTSKSAIKQKIISAKKKNVPLLIFSTYHSVRRVNDAAKECKIKVQTYIFDEAQYCVTNGEFKNVPNFPSAYKFFFTATEKTTDDPDGLGMNNETKFGKLIFTEKPKTMIERGEMSSVALHLVGIRGQEIVDDGSTIIYESMARMVIDAFEKHRNVIKGYFAPDKIGPKMIVVCDKQDSLKGIMKSQAMKQYKMDNESINLCALSSDFGIEINDEWSWKASNSKKEELLVKLRELKSEDEVIVLHVDMIAEGLDVPGITAIMPFRSLGKIKFLQNLGRGTRLIDVDRHRLYDFEINPEDWKNYVKPYCWLILPVLSANYYDQRRRYTDYINILRSCYDFESSDLVIIDSIVAPPEEEPMKDLVGQKERRFLTGKDLIEEIIHSIEDAAAMTEFMDNEFSFKGMSTKKQIELLQEIYRSEP